MLSLTHPLLSPTSSLAITFPSAMSLPTPLSLRPSHSHSLPLPLTSISSPTFHQLQMRVNQSSSLSILGPSPSLSPSTMSLVLLSSSSSTSSLLPISSSSLESPSSSPLTSSSFYDSPAPIVHRAILIVALIVVVVVTQRSKFDPTVASSSLLFAFWLLHLLSHTLKLQHFSRAAAGEVAFVDEELETKLFATVVITAGAALVSLALVGGEEGKRQGSPLDSASVASKWTFFWMMPLLMRGFKNQLEMKDLPPLPFKMKIENLVERFYEEYGRKFRDRNVQAIKFTTESPFNATYLPSIFKVLFSCHLSSLLFQAFLRILFIANDLVKTVCLGYLLQHLSDRYEETTVSIWYWNASFYIVLIFIVTIAQTYCHNFFWFYTNTLGLKVQSALTVAIFDKSLRVTSGHSQSTSVGEIVNLMSVDARKFYEGIQLFVLGLLIPLHVILAMWMLHNQIGSAAFAGIACLVALLPINAVIAIKIKNLQQRHMKLKDTRVKMMNEILNGIKVLKFYAWEESFLKRVEEVRKQELKVLGLQLLWQGIVRFLTEAAPMIVVIVSISVFFLISEEKLTAAKAFMSLSILNSIRISLSLFPTSLLFNVHMFVSGRRIDAFLTRREIDSDDVDHESIEGISVRVEHASFSWERGEPPFLQDLTFDLKVGQMLALVGGVGAGKSAVIKAILGEMNKVTGTVNTPTKIAYVSQQPWIQNGTVKCNILFGNEMRKEWYNSVLAATALGPDLENLPAGDETEIGERGVNLSGGQKLRISLARAIYGDMDLYLLDDPLSAVDTQVGKYIFDKVLSAEGLLGKKSRIVVTNALNHLPEMDGIICLSKGRIERNGSILNLKSNDGRFSNFLNRFREQFKRNSDLERTPLSLNVRESGLKIVTDKMNGRLTTVENVNHGMVSFRAYLDYLKTTGRLTASMFFISFTLSRAFEIGTNLTLADWMDEIQNITAPPGANSTLSADINSRYQLPYVLVGLSSSTFLLISVVLHIFGSLSASRRLHGNLTRRVLESPLSFFDVTPLGRIVNRFSVDMDIIDAKIPNDLFFAYGGIFYGVGSFAAISLVKPWFLLGVPFLVGGFVAVQRVYLRSARQLRRIESTSRSPIFSLFGETLRGMSVLRAFKKQDDFKGEARFRVAENLRAAFYMRSTNIVLSFVLEQMASLIVLFCALFAIFEESTTVGEAGLTITYAMSMVHIMIYSVQTTSNLENSFIALERIKEYSTMPIEAPWRNQRKGSVNSNWPLTGEISFKDYSAKYRENLDLVLKNLNFDIKDGQKIGIVGRTGSGKSTLTLALFRIIEAASGGVAIDGLETKELGLYDLRSRISIIPQDPVVFSGSLRINIDPFGLHDDEELWRAIDLAHLKELASALPAGLDHECVEAGENLSLGQRQLVCLARALLRNSKILVLDEATAAVDSKTDALIQKTIREEFVGATVLTIAHRIDTIVDYDKVMVMERGEIVEFDSPATLMGRKTSAFYELARDAGIFL